MLCSTVAPGVADADWKIERAKAVAAKAWSDPCPGRVQILSAPPRQPCPVLVHEYGHLAGYRDPLNPSDPFHSHDPDNIMYAFLHSDARCSDHGTPC